MNGSGNGSGTRESVRGREVGNQAGRRDEGGTLPKIKDR